MLQRLSTKHAHGKRPVRSCGIAKRVSTTYALLDIPKRNSAPSLRAAMRALPLFAATALIAASSAHAQSTGSVDPLLDHMIGRWVLRGQIAGRATTHDVT